jgi:hypothetical protein
VPLQVAAQGTWGPQKCFSFKLTLKSKEGNNNVEEYIMIKVAWIIFVLYQHIESTILLFVFETGICYATQAAFRLLGSYTPPTSAFQVLGLQV